jgi:hypothetical protein
MIVTDKWPIMLPPPLALLRPPTTSSPTTITNRHNTGNLPRLEASTWQAQPTTKTKSDIAPSTKLYSHIANANYDMLVTVSSGDVEILISTDVQEDT